MKTFSSGQSTLVWVSQTWACSLLWSGVKNSSWHTAVSGSWVAKLKAQRCCTQLQVASRLEVQMHPPACRVLGLHRAQADASPCLQTAGPLSHTSRCILLPAECWVFIARKRMHPPACRVLGLHRAQPGGVCPGPGCSRSLACGSGPHHAD